MEKRHALALTTGKSEGGRYVIVLSSVFPAVYVLHVCPQSSDFPTVLLVRTDRTPAAFSKRGRAVGYDFVTPL